MFRRFLYYLSVTAASVGVLWALGPSLDDLLSLIRPGPEELLVESDAPELPFILLPDYLGEPENLVPGTFASDAPATDTLEADAMASLPGDELFIFGAPASGDAGSAGVPDVSSLPPPAAGPGEPAAAPESGGATGPRDFTGPDSAPPQASGSDAPH